MTDEEVKFFRAKCQMSVEGKDVPKPVRDFNDLSEVFNSKVLNEFTSKGYNEPTPIQAQGWPMALKGRDMVGIAQTGSGKTISFVLPGLIHASKQIPLRKNDGPIILILAPTRELCLQILQEAQPYARIFNLNAIAVHGGVSADNQKKALLEGVEFLVATPGRLIDLHESGFCPLNRVTFLVLDEADRMLDMGFEPQLRKIIPLTNPKRQTLMWSATWPKEVYNLASSYFNNYIQVNIGSKDLNCNKDITQNVLFVSPYEKKNLLLNDLNNQKNNKVIIFVNMKRTADDLERDLWEKQIKCAAIHGDKSQNIRDRIIADFRSGRCLILIATDVAARGLDVKDVKLVINYDFPNNPEDYVHRIGRTGRGGEKGEAVTYFTSADSSNASELCNILKTAEQRIPNELIDMTRQKRNFGPNRYRRW
ncbi:ATP-dependent RNA helicase [Tubulinosema ratisbonensis]|uniref:RNA helicase n=1 Tax=Tubulinosema ratisbonensis TaxID=291195 RepID=A0A437AK59_9MICR|nr:ATP-dependent RNA helicase [Tubulinosema ratisbonensis]